MSFWMRGFLSLLLITAASGFAQNPEQSGQPIHEAFVVPIKGSVILEAVADEPPARLTEKIPPSPGPLEEWIPGYWTWDKKKGDFAWVCGVWRKPPPGHIWNPGYWKKFDEGWVWIAGFWHTQPAQYISFIQKSPPSAISENIGNPPSRNYFWTPGFWEYSRNRNSYAWRGGRWESLDPKWIFTPASYSWRPEGYVFIPAYWDWPLKDRGAAYCNMALQPGRGIVQTPTIIIEPEIIIESLFIYWPDYVCFFHHWWFYHPDFWGTWCCVPPWWGWGGGWWGVDWFHMWDMWWWWGTPGFPFPWWLTLAVNGALPPPPPPLLPLMGDAFPPPIINIARGPLPPNDLINAIREVTGNDRPIFPADPGQREAIENLVTPPAADQGALRPSGQPGDQAPSVPEFPQENIETGPVQTLPPIPETPSTTPEIRPVPSPWPPATTIEPPQYTPPVQYPRIPPQEMRRPMRPRPQFNQPMRRPWRPAPQYQPPQQAPSYQPSPPSWTETPQYTPPPQSTPQYNPPSQSTPQLIRPQFRPQQMQPQRIQPQQIQPQTTPSTEVY